MEYGVCVQLLLMQTKDPSSWTLLYQNYSLISATAYKTTPIIVWLLLTATWYNMFP